MRAWQLDRLGGHLKLLEAPVPEPRPGTVVLRLEASVLMSYIQRYVAGDLPFYDPPDGPFTIGSNGIFTIHAVGRDVWHLRPGQRVILSSHLVAQENVPDPSQLLLGVTSLGDKRMQRDFPDGVLADFAVVPKQLVTPIDDAPPLPAAQLATAIRFIIPYGGWLRGQLAAGDTAVVTGATGSYGSAAVLLALALGAARVVAAGRDPQALAAITRDRVVPVRLTGDRTTDAAAIRAAAGGGAHVALDLVGSATDPNATLAALHALRRNGRLVLMGSATVPIPIDYMALLANNWELIGQFMYPADGYRRLFELVRAGLLDLTAITPHSYSLAELPAAIAAAAHVGSLGCVVVTP
ncbi:MAG TPA: zinc-binding dehydrogenase [Kofleriaceae bacterium]|jgi:alcohol dehydrogenase|nr:zinc-binding dehydrogenase [Kofleriaceae bacterium]